MQNTSIQHSSFQHSIETFITELTNPEGFHGYGDEWKKMEDTDLSANMELLILAGA